MRSRRAAVGALGLVLVLMTACGSVTTGTGTAPSGSAGSSGSSGPTSSAQTSSPPLPSPSVPSVSVPGEVEFSGVNYKIPAGFVAATGFSPDVPLEDDINYSYYVAPEHDTSGNGGVISIVVYGLPADATVGTIAQQRARIVGYNAKLKFTARKALHQTTLAGRPAWSEYGRQPPSFRYTAWFVFGKSHVLELTCQLGTPATDGTLTTGCHRLVNSLKIR